MLVTLLRHATAEDHALLVNDAERALVKKGNNQAIRLANFCRKHSLIPAALYSSPLLRASQTAGVLQNRLPHCPPVTQVDWLTIGTAPQVIIQQLEQLNADGFNDVWLVGHEPDLSVLVSQLLRAPQACIAIKKASLTRIEIDFSTTIVAQLQWSLPCALMR